MNLSGLSAGALRRFDGIKILISFLLLFLLYHAAEYQIVGKDSAIGFLLFQAAFWIMALLLGMSYRRNGLTAWGLPFSPKVFKLFFLGIILGAGMYAVTFVILVKSGIERVVDVPDLTNILQQSLPFTFGVFLSSLSEDVLTRGLVYSYFRKKTSGLVIVLISATVYTLNHIYRLGDGMDSLLYLFLLGAIFMTAMINTRNLWLTGGMHWAGNVFFYVSHNVVRTETTTGAISSNYLFAAVIAVFIPVVWLTTRKFNFTISGRNDH